MSVLSHLVSFEASVHFAKQRSDLGISSRTAHAGCRISNYRGYIHKLVFQNRRKSQNNAGWITTRIGYQPGLFNFIPVKFRKTVNGLSEKIGTAVFCIPFFVNSKVPQTIIGRKINDLPARVDEHGHDIHGNTMRQGQKSHVAKVGNLLWSCI